MRLRLVMVLAVMLAATWSVEAGDFEVDEDFMHDVEDTSKSLTNHLALNNKTASNDDVLRLIGMFSKVESYYTLKGDSDEQLGLAQKSHELTKEIKFLVDAGDFEHAGQKATVLSRTCKSCHDL